MSSADLADILQEKQGTLVDSLICPTFAAAITANQHKSLYDPSLRNSVPHMKVWEVAGDMSMALVIRAFWELQDENNACGGHWVQFKMIPGANHFVGALSSMFLAS
jgi:hypothetical protein